MSQKGTFRVLLVWVDGREELLTPDVVDEITEAELEALREAAARRTRKSFLLLARRNWELEYITRRVRLPGEVRRLFKLADGEAVDRLIGYVDGDRWRPGIAGLEPAESRALRYRVIERWSTWEIGAEMHVRHGSVRVYVAEGRRKLRAYLGLDERTTVRGNVVASGPPMAVGRW